MVENMSIKVLNYAWNIKISVDFLSEKPKKAVLKGSSTFYNIYKDEQTI